jgi:hypothetical protein
MDMKVPSSGTPEPHSYAHAHQDATTNEREMMSSVVARTGPVTVSARAATVTNARHTKCRMQSTRVVSSSNNNRRVTLQRRHGAALSLRAAADDSSAEVVEGQVVPTPAAAKPTPLKPAAAEAAPKPGVGKPPISPVFLALGDFAAAVVITAVARGAAGQDVLSAGTLVAIPPFVVGWVGAGFLAGDYDADSPNAALWVREECAPSRL